MQFFTKLVPYTLIGLVFVFPISFKIAIYMLFISVLFWLLSGVWYSNIKSILNFKPAVMLIVLWLLLIISLLYTENIDRGVSDIVQKIAFLFIPLILISHWNSIRIFKRKIITAYLISLTLLAVFLIFRALYSSLLSTPNGILFQPNPQSSPWENYFFYFLFTQPNHPTYLSMYYCLGLVFIASIIKNSTQQIYKSFYPLLAFLFLAMVYLSSSKAGIITCFFICIMTLFWVLKKKGRMISGIAVVVIIGTLLALLSYNSRIPSFINYFNDKTNDGLTKNEIAFDNKLKSEATVRLEIWSSIPKMVNNRWLFGVGIGDTKQELVSGYEKYGVKYAAEKMLNAHNQYLEIFVGLGIVGLTAFLIALGLGFRQAVHNRDMVLFLFLSIVSVNFLFESVLERFFGIIFFVFFFTFLSLDGSVE